MDVKNLQTIAVQTYSDGLKLNRPLSIPIHQATTYQAVSSSQHGEDFKSGAAPVYTRFRHPTLVAASQKVAELEKAEAGLVFSSGMGAITTALLSVLKSGDHVVSQREVFAQTYTFMDTTCRALGISVDFVDAANYLNVVSAIKPNTKLIYIETPSNPLLEIVDIKAIAAIAKVNQILVFIDSTFASPFCQNPLEYGVDLVIHSGTKYLSGHSDIMCGAVAGSEELVGRIQRIQVLLGSILDPHAAWLLLRGIKTLAIRMEAITRNAMAIAEHLSGEKKIKKVNYPWLKSAPMYDVASKQMRAGGGVISFEVDGGLEEARRFVDHLELIPIATSLGGVETLIEIPYELDFNEAALGTEVVASRGVPPNLIRISVGIEALNDLIADLRKGISAI